MLCIRIAFAIAMTPPIAQASPTLKPQEPFLNIHLPHKKDTITIGFTGHTLQLYGATNIDGNVIVIIKGNARTYTIHKKVHSYAFWLDQKIATVKNVPQFYAVYSMRPHKASPHFSVYSMPRDIQNAPSHTSIGKSVIRGHFIRLKIASGAYQYNPMGITFMTPYMFQMTVHIPSNISAGTYTVSAYIQDKNAPTPHIVAKAEKQVYIVRSPLINFIYSSARDYPSIYGIFAIVASLIIGLGAGMLRKR